MLKRLHSDRCVEKAECNQWHQKCGDKDDRRVDFATGLAVPSLSTVVVVIATVCEVYSSAYEQQRTAQRYTQYPNDANH